MKNAPINAATPTGKFARSISSSRSVLENIPIKPAVIAIFRGLLNISENPYTPKKLVMIRRMIVMPVSISSAGKSAG